MRKMIVHLSVGFVGMGACEALLVEDDATEDEIAQEAWYMALAHAESYGFYPPQDDEEEEDYPDSISNSIEGLAEDYVPEKHDRKRAGGGSFERDFARLLR